MAPPPPKPGLAPDCNAANDGLCVVCKKKDDSIRLVQLIECYKHGGNWKERNVDSRKQFINLDDQVQKAQFHPEYGRTIWLKARIRWVSGKKDSLQGKQVYWYSVASNTNKKGLQKAQQESFASAGGGTAKKPYPTDKDGWTDRIPFYLSLYGGDRFSIYATLHSGYKGGLKSGPLYRLSQILVPDQ